MQFAEGPDGPVDDVAVAACARKAGLAVLPLSIWYANGRARRTLRGLVMGFANIADAREAAVSRERCARVWTADARGMCPDPGEVRRGMPLLDATGML